MRKQLLVLGVVAILSALVVAAGLMSVQPTQQVAGIVDDGLHYGSVVTLTQYRPGVGIISQQTFHNVVTDEGKDYIKAMLGSSSSGFGSMNYFGLSNNATYTPAAATTGALWKSDVTEITGSGLDRATASYFSNGVGNWTLSKTWTASGAKTGIKLAGMFNDTYANTGNMLAVNGYTSVDLQALDQLTLNWTVSIS
jgi:hypothetical protein